MEANPRTLNHGLKPAVSWRMSFDRHVLPEAAPPGAHMARLEVEGLFAEERTPGKGKPGGLGPIEAGLHFWDNFRVDFNPGERRTPGFKSILR